MIFKMVVSYKILKVKKKEMQNGIWKRLRDGVILEPNISGIGFNLKTSLENHSKTCRWKIK